MAADSTTYIVLIGKVIEIFMPVTTRFKRGWEWGGEGRPDDDSFDTGCLSPLYNPAPVPFSSTDPATLEEYPLHTHELQQLFLFTSSSKQFSHGITCFITINHSVLTPVVSYLFPEARGLPVPYLLRSSSILTILYK